MLLNEEKYLQGLLGEKYTAHMKTTPRFISNFRKWQAREEVTINLKLVLRTLLDGSLAILLIPLVELIEYLS